MCLRSLVQTPLASFKEFVKYGATGLFVFDGTLFRGVSKEKQPKEANHFGGPLLQDAPISHEKLINHDAEQAPMAQVMIPG